MIPPVRRVVWLTEKQRAALLQACEQHATRESSSEFCAAVGQLQEAKKRERITGRLVRGHVTGLRLPHDAIPVRLTDEEATVLCQLPDLDETLQRLLDPHW